MPDGCDMCPGEDDDGLDEDSDGIPDACDACMEDPDNDTDNDGICDKMDPCLEGGPSDLDGDGVADACDACPLDNPDDSDSDGVCDADDQCPDGDDAIDTDEDGVADACDPCPLDATDDSDDDGVCDSDDLCPGSDDSADRDADGKPDACDHCAVGAESTPRPTDIIVLVANNVSMTDIISGVESNITGRLHQPLATGNEVDAQVIMVSDHGSATNEICVTPPLSETTNCSGPPVEIAGQFRHYDANIGTLAGVCTLFDTLYGSNSGGMADARGAHPNGWAAYLRPEATKVVISASNYEMACSWQSPGVINTFDRNCDPTSNNPDATARAACFNDGQSTDTNSTTSQAAWAAQNVEDTLARIAPDQFGANAEKLRWYSLSAMTGSQTPLLPTDPLDSMRCGSIGALGTGYQWLSMNTGGLRDSTCDLSSYGAFFDAIVADLEALPPTCALQLPAQTAFDPATWRLEVTDGNGMLTELSPVADEASCSSATEFWVDGTVATLCPLACDAFAADPDATADVVEPCE